MNQAVDRTAFEEILCSLYLHPQALGVCVYGVSVIRHLDWHSDRLTQVASTRPQRCTIVLIQVFLHEQTLVCGGRMHRDPSFAL